MACLTHTKRYQVGESFTAPRIVISALNATESQYVNAVVDFRLHNPMLGITVLADTLHKDVVLAALTLVDEYGELLETPEQYTMSLVADIDYSHMNIPPGIYDMRYEVTYPGGYRLFYGELRLCFD